MIDDKLQYIINIIKLCDRLEILYKHINSWQNISIIYLMKYTSFIRFSKKISFYRFIKTMVLSEMQYFMTSCWRENQIMQKENNDVTKHIFLLIRRQTVKLPWYWQNNKKYKTKIFVLKSKVFYKHSFESKQWLFIWFKELF